MPEARVGQYRHDISCQIEQDIGRGKDKAARLHNRNIPDLHTVDKQLADTGIDKHHLDHHNTGDQKG